MPRWWEWEVAHLVLAVMEAMGTAAEGTWAVAMRGTAGVMAVEGRVAAERVVVAKAVAARAVAAWGAVAWAVAVRVAAAG